MNFWKEVLSMLINALERSNFLFHYTSAHDYLINHTQKISNAKRETHFFHIECTFFNSLNSWCPRLALKMYKYSLALKFQTPLSVLLLYKNILSNTVKQITFLSGSVMKTFWEDERVFKNDNIISHIYVTTLIIY